MIAALLLAISGAPYCSEAPSGWQDSEAGSPKQARTWFEKLLEFHVGDQALEVRLKLHNNDIHKWFAESRSGLGHGGASSSTTSPGRGVFFATGSHFSMELRTDERGRLRRLAATLTTRDGDESIELGVTSKRRLRISYEVKGGVAVIFQQNTDLRCLLIVEDRKTSRVFHGKTFEDLGLKHYEPVGEFLIPALERFLASGPIYAGSSDAISFALSLRPPDKAQAATLAKRLSELDDESVKVREQATRALRQHIQRSAQAFQFLGQNAVSARSPEVGERIKLVLETDPRRWEAYRYVMKHGLHRDLPFLVKLLEAGRPANAQLKAVTGKSFESSEQWSTWVKENGRRLSWDPKAWRYRTTSPRE